MVTRILIMLSLLTTSASAQRICPPNQVNRNGLVGRWLVPGYQTGNGALPTKCLDTSGQGNHGTTVASPNYGVIYSRPAMTFNGSSQYVTIPNNGSFSFTNGTNDLPFSVSMWLKQTTQTGSQWIINKRTSPSSSGEWQIATTGGGYPIIQLIEQDNSSVLGKESTTILVASTWTHVVCTYDGSGTEAGLKIYQSGSAVGLSSQSAGAYTHMLKTSAPLAIATQGWSLGSSGFIGSIDDVRIYNRAMSAAEICGIYKGIQ